MTYSGFWKLALKHSDSGIQKYDSPFNKAAFVRNTKAFDQGIQADDLLLMQVWSIALMNDGKACWTIFLIDRNSVIFASASATPLPINSSKSHY